MCTLRFVLGDQLSHGLSALADLDPSRDVVLLAEVAEETTYVRHHKQKIALVLSAMRHFADELAGRGVRVDYVRLDDPASTGSFGGELRRAIRRHRPWRVVVTEPGEWRVWEMMQDWREELDVPLEIRDDSRFFCSRAAFGRWAAGQDELVLEAFYREMRMRTGLLMEGAAPKGGRWNFDTENRKRFPADRVPPPVPRFAPDRITEGVLDLVRRRFHNHFGDLEGFGWPVTRAEALVALDDFVAHRLAGFGDVQDAMREGAPYLHHSLLAPALNLGLLAPEEVCRRAEAAYDAGAAPLNAVEGFVRQILGWREYVRGIYWTRMPDYAATNALEARRDLPAFYWTGETEQNCLRQTITDTARHAYAHHIQRLMVTGNFALLAGVEPRQIEEWYLIVYADAFDWVELPNVHGLAAFADGGLLGSKPYAAAGAYINRMSDYCRSCRYEVKLKSGPDACPFNYLYWNFLIEHEARLKENPRLAMPYETLARLPPERRAEIRADAKRFLAGLGGGASGPSRRLTVEGRRAWGHAASLPLG